MEWLYVYYRLPQADLPAVCAQASALFARVQQARPDISPSLLRRPELRDGDITFMEVYGPLQAGSLAGLTEQIAGLLPHFPLLHGASRHTEKFTELSAAPCA